MKVTWAEAIRDVATLRKDMGIAVRSVYGVPRGGSVVAALLPSVAIKDKPEYADAIVDDVEDSGRTRRLYEARFPTKPFYTLFKKEEDRWIELPWDGPDQDISTLGLRLIEHYDDPKRPGLLETPARFQAAWSEMLSGYATDPKSLVVSFEDHTDELIIIRGVRFFSTCEHHLMPFFGHADIGYIPDGKIIGLSKVPRIVDVCARRLQTQEHLAKDIGDALMALAPRGVAVHLRAQHLCTMARGIRATDTEMETNYLTGCFKEEGDVRSEFFAKL